MMSASSRSVSPIASSTLIGVGLGACFGTVATVLLLSRVCGMQYCVSATRTVEHWTTVCCMGLLRRIASKSESGFWREVQLGPSEQPLEYAHLRCRSAREDLRGTLFLTSQRVIWRIHEAGLPPYTGFDKSLEDLKAGKASDEKELGHFVLVTEQDGETGLLLFSPQRRNSSASARLAEDLYLRIGREVKRARADVAK